MKKTELREAVDLIRLYDTLTSEPNHAGNLFGFTDYGVRAQIKDALLPHLQHRLRKMGVEDL